MSEHLYPCRIRTDPLAICDCKTNHMTPTASDECREAFEQDFVEFYLGRNKFGKYVGERTREIWIGYQAAWNRRAPAPAQAECKVVAWRMSSLNGLKPWWNGTPNQSDIEDSKTNGWTIEYAYSKPFPQQGKSEQGEAAGVLTPYEYTDEMLESGIEQLRYLRTRWDMWSEETICGFIFDGMMAPLRNKAAPVAPQPTAEGSYLRRAIQDWRRGADIADETHWVTALDFIERRAKELALTETTTAPVSSSPT